MSLRCPLFALAVLAAISCTQAPDMQIPQISIDGTAFRDQHGRTLLLRGVNLGGSTKVPFTPNGATHLREGFYNYRDVSFVGRPFPLDEADEHFARLRAWGFTFIRLLTTWEAVEHAGPGQYDEAYLDYLHAIVSKAADHGISVFIDPHQDVWSSWTGGDGAPAWTLEAVGIDIEKLAATGAAVTHATHDGPLPPMIWPTNYYKLGAATMFTLFFAGDDFAPQTTVDGTPVQEFLQSHYINAMVRVAQKLRDLPNIAGYDSLNEPGSGFIGAADLNQSAALLRLGPALAPFAGMLAAAGNACEVPTWEGTPVAPKTGAPVMLNPNGVRLWKEGYEPIWKQNGVWTGAGGQARLLRPDHFASIDGRQVNFEEDYLKPFLKRYTAAIRAVDPDAIIFLEGSPFSGHPSWGADDPPGVVNAAHWYDAATLLTKSFHP
ncbi:MAG: glycoside hydrolase family 5 protein, partial [bacterium]|nr:glycoside hydrolase family 5 protein [bacterium]